MKTTILSFYFYIFVLLLESFKMQILPNPETFARFTNATVTKYLTEIKVNHSIPLVLPLRYVITQVHVLPDKTLNDISLYKYALEDLGKKKEIVRISPANGKCISSGTYDKTLLKFCIYSLAGYVFLTGKETEKSKGIIMRYKLNILVKDSSKKPIPSNGSVVVNIMTSCFPMDHLYSLVLKYCPIDKNIISAVPILKFPTRYYKLYVKSNTIFGKIFIKTNHTSSFFSRNYTVTIHTKWRTYTQHFEYHNDIETLENSQRDNFFPRVFGYTFDVVFTQEIYVQIAQTVSISIRSQHSEIEFYTADALTLIASRKLQGCPSILCLQVFIQWKYGYEYLTKARKTQCTRDDENVYAQLSFCKGMCM